MGGVTRKNVPNVLSRCNTKRRTGAATRTRDSFGMTTTQDIKDLFAYRGPIMREDAILN